MDGIRLRSVKTSVYLAAFLAAGAFTASAQTVEFRGQGELRLETSQCSPDWDVGVRMRPNVRFRPANVGDNGSSTRFSFFFDYYGGSLYLERGSLSKKFRKFIGAATRSATSFYERDPEVSLISLSPAKITTKTKSVRFSIAVKGFDDIPGCNGVLKGSLAVR